MRLLVGARIGRGVCRVNGLSLVLCSISLVVLLAGTGLFAAQRPSSKIDPNDLSFYRPSEETAARLQTAGRGADNVIFCIGDGMGLGQVALARVTTVGLDGKLCMERLPVAGLVRSHAANSSVTDSAAAGTALACGVKTNNGMIGMTPDEQGYCTILEAARDKGMATGLVVTSTISHATPACFAAHVKSRKSEGQIAEQLIANRVNVLFGGGKKFFLPKTAPKSGRKDSLDLLAAAQAAGYQYAETAEAMQTLCGPYVLGLFQLEGLKTVAPEPSLAQLTRKAIELLAHIRSDTAGGRGGFFLMVEGSQIDWECHSNKAAGAIRQTLLFDQAVEAAVDFALQDGHTLVLVTADHETGGLSLIGGGNEDKPDAQLTARWSTKGHSGIPVAIHALGPGATQFGGVQDNTEIPAKIARLLNITPFPRPTRPDCAEPAKK
jgi:alkaline phosphatase